MLLLIALIIIVSITLITIITYCCVSKSNKKNFIKNQLLQLKQSHNFTTSKKVVDTYFNHALAVDESANKFAIINTNTKKCFVINFTDLIRFEVLIDHTSVITDAALVPEKVAIKKSYNSIIISLAINNFNTPKIIIPLLSSKTAYDSTLYKNTIKDLDSFTSFLTIIKTRNQPTSQLSITPSIKSFVKNTIIFCPYCGSSNLYTNLKCEYCGAEMHKPE